MKDLETLKWKHKVRREAYLATGKVEDALQGNEDSERADEFERIRFLHDGIYNRILGESGWIKIVHKILFKLMKPFVIEIAKAMLDLEQKNMENTEYLEAFIEEGLKISSSEGKKE